MFPVLMVLGEFLFIKQHITIHFTSLVLLIRISTSVENVIDTAAYLIV